MPSNALTGFARSTYCYCAFTRFEFHFRLRLNAISFNSFLWLLFHTKKPTTQQRINRLLSKIHFFSLSLSPFMTFYVWERAHRIKTYGKKIGRPPSTMTFAVESNYKCCILICLSRVNLNFFLVPFCLQFWVDTRIMKTKNNYVYLNEKSWGSPATVTRRQ